MKVNKQLFCFVLAAMTLSSCNMDYNEYTAYDKEYIQRSFKYVGGLMTTIYTDIDTDWGNLSGAMLSLLLMSLNIATMAMRWRTSTMATGVLSMLTRQSGNLLMRALPIAMR